MSSKFTPAKPKATHSNQLTAEELRRMEVKQYGKLIETNPNRTDQELMFLLGVSYSELAEIKNG
jgi:hypothetical protein